MLLIAQRFDADKIHVQLGRIATTVARNGRTSETLETADALQARLSKTFGIEADVRPLWPAICEAHARYFETEDP